MKKINKFEYNLEIYGYSGRLIDDLTFTTEEKARLYSQKIYGGDGGIAKKLYKCDIYTGNRTELII